ncbi:alpha-ketoglutarate-dependent dioxygenase AlkB family protein [Parasediminibacterium sp. JCM 36343]|uniref:alpha-ketoglutarate-dependent dioxygenase AlkB family protein n=1 Tax=Parasediminibacterium sp. JCM 36343 TaxID=3374279 RepID=UPI00397C72BA
MQLPIFDTLNENLLPCDGEMFLYEHFFQQAKVEDWFTQLQNTIAWKQEGMKMYGKEVNFPRLTAWYGEEGKTYKYSGLVNIPVPFTGLLLEMKTLIENKTNHRFNSALLNLYRNGQDSMGWHSDNEPELGVNPTIASVSFGGERVFQLKHKQDKQLTRSIVLKDNSLLLMQGAIQHHWLHQIPKTAKPTLPRINITFRKTV